MRFSFLYSGKEDTFNSQLRAEAEKEVRASTSDLPPDEVALQVDAILSGWVEPEADDSLNPSDVEEAVVLIGDEVARYYDLSKGDRDRIDDDLGVLLPPFPRLWVEAEGAPNIVNAHALGSLDGGKRGSVGLDGQGRRDDL